MSDEARAPSESVVEHLGSELANAYEGLAQALKVRRAQRDVLNEEIRQLVAEQKTVAQVLGAYRRAGRARKTEQP